MENFRAAPEPLRKQTFVVSGAIPAAVLSALILHIPAFKRDARIGFTGWIRRLRGFCESTQYVGQSQRS